VLTPDGDLERSRAEFEAKVRSTPRVPAPAPGGKGSPAALLTIGVISTLVLGATAAALGGGLLYVPALLPLVTVLAVLGARLVTRSVSSAGGP
jgi:hypothetical protein